MTSHTDEAHLSPDHTHISHIGERAERAVDSFSGAMNVCSCSATARSAKPSMFEGFGLEEDEDEDEDMLHQMLKYYLIRMVVYVLIHIIGLEGVQRIAMVKVQRNFLLAIHRDQVCRTQERVKMYNRFVPPPTRTIRAHNPHSRDRVASNPLEPFDQRTGILRPTVCN